MNDEPPIRHLFSAAEAERVLNIPAATIRSWAGRKRIYSYGLNERNQPMYDRDHLVELRDRKVNRDYDGKRRKPRQRANAPGHANLARRGRHDPR